MKIKYKSLMAVLAAALLAVGSSSYARTGTEYTPEVKSDSELQFRCLKGYDYKLDKRVPSTYAWTKRGKLAVVRWVTDHFERAGYDPWRRCYEVSNRFQKAYKNGSLEYLTNGTINGQKVICTARSAAGGCEDLSIALRPGDNELEILASLERVLLGRSDTPVYHESDDPEDIPQIYVEVDMEEFIRTAPFE
ncbi:MAG: hypothetical protein GDA38_26600 [Hormoscilla sp. SP12CHS1]|nr:hypothetical protein [Hormoscilla sp. SP12CHS1]